LGHLTSAEPKTSFSKSSPQAPHLYSKMGMPNYSKAPPPPATPAGGTPGGGSPRETPGALIIGLGKV
jgi:hypothetical protein